MLVHFQKFIIPFILIILFIKASKLNITVETFRDPFSSTENKEKVIYCHHPI